MSARRVTMLFLELPQRSRSMLFVGGEDAAWDLDRTLLGAIAEKIDGLHVTTVKVAGGRVKAPPTIVPRPKARPLAAAPALSILDDLDRELAKAASDGS